MAVELKLTTARFLIGGVLVVLIVAPRSNAMTTGSSVRQRTSAVDYGQQVSSGTNNSTNGSASEKPEGLPIYLNPGNGSGVGCIELRSKRYISDGHCTSIRPLTEVICSGVCLPMRTLPGYSDFVRTWAGTNPIEWRCVDDVVRKRKVTLLCEDGTARFYQVRVVKNCRCKQVARRRHMVSETRKRGGDRRAPLESENLERTREVNEKRRKSRRNERRSKYRDTST